MHADAAFPLLESVPNVSVGRDRGVVDELVARVHDGIAAGAARDASRAELADVHRDSDHDRSVLTLVGGGEALASGLEALADAVVEHVDLHAGHGVHPRVGVLDVCPVVPLEDGPAAFDAAHELVARVAAHLASLDVPTVAYGLTRARASIAGAAFAGAARRGGPGTVTDRVEAGELRLLDGPVRVHPTAGVTLAGVRDVLVAFNVDLASDDLDAARAIATAIRASADGPAALPGIRALGLRLVSRGVAQVSTNVERHAECGPARVLEVVHRAAAEHGLELSAAELVGLAPETAVAPLRYACTRLGVPLLAAASPSLDAALARVLNSGA
jgi:glutamate formiminotransferase